MRPGTADRYGGLWAAFAAYCRSRGVRALPATTATVVHYIGYQWRRGTVVAATLKPMLAAVRKRHVAAGFGNPCNSELVREAKAGFRRAGLTFRPDTRPIRIPLPSAIAWRQALLAPYTPMPLRHRLTAVVLQFWWLRRAADITRLRLQDVELPADGPTCYQVPDHKTALRDGLIARTFPAAPPGHPDRPRQLLARVLSDRRAAGTRNDECIFPRCPTAAASKLVTGWLREGLQRLGVSAPAGTVFASHSLKKGGATSAAAAGVSRGAIAELSNTSEHTLAESYISALAVPSCYDRYFFGPLRSA